MKTQGAGLGLNTLGIDGYQSDYWAARVAKIRREEQEALKKSALDAQKVEEPPKQNYTLREEKPKKEDPSEKPTENLVSSLGDVLSQLSNALGGAGQCGDPSGIGTENGGVSTFGCYDADPDVKKMIETAKNNATFCTESSYNKGVCNCSGGTCTKDAKDSAAWCARHVSDALCHHDYKATNSEKPNDCSNNLVSSRTNANGKNMDEPLAEQGFVNLKEIYGQMDKENAPIGAIFVYEGKGEEGVESFGHVAIKTAEGEVSDFIQEGQANMPIKAIMVKKSIFEKCAQSLMPDKKVASN